jgi:hypothetical protein
MTPLQRFGKYAAAASYHYADDSTKEWVLARRAKDNAMKVYRAHPDLWEQMDAIGKDQLWGREFIRLSDEIKSEESA